MTFGRYGKSNCSLIIVTEQFYMKIGFVHTDFLFKISRWEKIPYKRFDMKTVA